MSMHSPPLPGRQQKRRLQAFWLLTGIAVSSAGSLTHALTAPPAPATGLWTAATGTLLVISLIFAARILSFDDRVRREWLRAGRASAAEHKETT